jgi:hypothetical protein
MTYILKKSAIQPRVDEWPDAPIAPDDASELDRLTYPRGLLGHVVQYMIDTARLPSRWLALGCSLAACAKGIDRKVIGPTGCSNVLYNLIAGFTGIGKQHYLNCTAIALRAMGVEECYRAGGIASVQAIEQMLEGSGKDDDPPQPNILVIIDELGSYLSRIGSKNQTGNVAEIPGLLQTLWGWPPEDIPWKSSMKVGKNVKGIYSPAFSILGFSTEEKLFSSLKKSDAATGFLNRMTLWNAGRGWQGDLCTPKYHWTQIPAWLGKALKDVTSYKSAPAHEPMLFEDERFGLVRDFHRVPWGDGAEDIYKEFEKNIRQMPDPDDREIWIRASEQAVRIGLIHAHYRGSPVFAPEDTQWSIAVAQASTKQLHQAHTEYAKEDLDQADLVRRIREQFKKRHRLTWGQVRKTCERQTGDYRRIDAAIQHLVQTGEIVLETADDKDEWRGRPSTAWIYTRQRSSANFGVSS